MGYDALGRVTSKFYYDTVNNPFTDAFNSKDTASWTWSSYQTVPYSDSGNNVVKSTGNGVDWGATFYRSSYNLTNGKGIQVRFKVDNANTSSHLSIESDDGINRRFGIIASNGKIFVQYGEGNNYIYPADLINPLEINVWYVLQIVVDDVGGFTVHVYNESNPAVRGAARVVMAAGKSWRFRHWVYSNNSYLDDYREITPTIYQYDQGTNGIGQRTGMLDVSGSTGWTYDQRGRMTGETKVVSGTGGGTFFTQWGGYNAADQVGWMKYPGGNTGQVGEQVNFTYKRQMALNSVSGTNTYVQSTSYDAAGRVDVRMLSGGAFKTDYDYFNWYDENGLGRLRVIKSGTSGSPTSMQSLSYTYDAVGNVKTITDAPAGVQVQTFTYDNLNRLWDATASNGSGGIYPKEVYTYTATTGNLFIKAGLNYVYDSVHKHAVVKTAGSGNNSTGITIRAKGSICQSAWPIMKLFVNGVERGSWTVASSNYGNYTTSVSLTGADQLDVVFTNDCYVPGVEDRNLYVDYVTVGSTTYQMEGGAVLKMGNTNGTGWTNVSVGGELLASNGGLRFMVGQGAFAGWYDANGNLVYRLVTGAGQILSYDAENRLIQVQTSITTSTLAYDGEGKRVKGTVGGVTTTYIGNYFEWTGSTSTMVKYYYAGGQRVAMMVGSTVYYLLTDHLGSTALTVTSAGAIYAEKRYKPWGEERYTSGTTPTSFRFTGQRIESFGLYYYGARWYDPYITQFTQPDSIIPDPYNPLDWNRYAYARSNPLKYTDPTGHFPWLLIPILIFIATIPGDTGPYEVDPATAAVGEAALRLVDPVDWVYTGVDCLSGNCSGTDLVFGVLPFVNGGMDDAADAARALGSTDALAHADDVVETAGQFHHIFSNKIMTILDRHETLGGVFNRDNFIVQGLDAASHNGYQAWHRAYDQEVVNWLSDNPRATPEQFLSYMRDLYKRTEIDKRFPQAWQQLQMAIEEWE